MLKQDRPVKVVIRGLPSNTESEDIKTEIEAEGFKVHKISQMKNYRTNAPMPLFHLQIENGECAPKIYDFTELFGTRIEVKPFDHGNKINQCCSDHNPVILEINLNTSIIKNPEQLSTNWNNFKFALTKKPISTLDLTSNENIERTISELNQNFSEAFVEASKPKFKNTPKILSPEIKSKIHQRNKLRKIWQRTRCPSIYSEFRTRSREIAKDIKAHSCTQWEKHIEALLPVDNTLRRKSSLLRKPFRSIPPLQGALGSTAITPIEKAEVIADSLQRSRHLYAPYFSSLNVFSINDLIFWRQLSQSSYSSFQGLKDIATSIRFFADQFTT
ncbi:zinc finger protein [Trichonephila clavipes]|nr:zinc finger protein [Trichonephila clavipes]